MGYTLADLGCNQHKAVCRCGGFSKDHDVEFQYWPDPEFGDTFSISTGLNHFRPWYKRLWVGIKYILGIDNTHYFYVESELDGAGVRELSEWISAVAADYQEVPLKKAPEDE